MLEDEELDVESIDVIEFEELINIHLQWHALYWCGDGKARSRKQES